MKRIFEWIGKFVICVFVALLVRVLFVYFGADNEFAAMFSGIALAIAMFKTGLIKAGV